MNETPLVNSPEMTVSELSAALRRTVEDAYSFVRVRGEITGYRGPHSSGHAYFGLKDESAKIDAVVWRGTFGRLRFKPQEGLEVIATGRLTTYPGRSSYQIVVENLEPAGIGALMALVEERKRKLAAEGLFDEARKQLLPFLPGVVGVITSPTGAVIRDILHRLADRFPRHVLLWPVRVQGEGAAPEIAAAIDGMNALEPGGAIPRPDLIIVARGGGSLEDLWAFNEEIVVRAAASSMIPLISAVGHETDVTLIDFAADKRAPTPTAAAEMAVPVRSDLAAQVDRLARRNFTCWRSAQDHRRVELRGLARALPTPDRIFGDRRQRVDLTAGRLLRGLGTNAHVHRAWYARVDARFQAYPPHRQVAQARQRWAGGIERLDLAGKRILLGPRERVRIAADRIASGLRANQAAHLAKIARERAALGALHTRLTVAVGSLLDRRDDRLDRLAGLLGALSYQGVLARGFALVRSTDGSPLRTAAAINAGTVLDIEFSDGKVHAIATDATRTATPPIPRRRRQRTPSPQQATLFDE